MKRLMAREDVTEIVNACDAGREGELIFRLVYELAGCRKPVLRLWVSSMEDSAIREGFSELRPGADYEALYQSALCRQRADWLVGINATRLFSVLYHRIPTRLFKQAVNLSKQARAIEATLDGINPLNAGKKKEEALAMLKKWFPQMENFSGQLKKYKVTINDLLAENEKLEERARASENGKIKDRMERAKLESKLHDIQRLVDRIPPDILVELKRQKRHTRER